MRGLLLWMARNRWLRDHLPKLWFARRAVRRFMPGEDSGSALDAATSFRSEGIASEFTRLGENITTVDEGDAVVEHYLGLMDEIRARGLDGEVSVKLTQLGYDLDVERTLEHARRLAGKAAEHGKTLWIDMEGSAYAEGTVSFYERLKATHANTGLCLQAYLHRTAADVQRLLPLDPAIRLVKGAYGTHDVELIEQIAEHTAAMGLPKTSFEVQMLYGIRMDQQRRLASEGYLVRDLIAYGEAWYPWYMRRLAERPANVIFALRQIIG
jgi:proline dehydrogenase